MKPNRSRVFCPSARKQKIKFDSKEAAKRFINWNGKEILEENGYAPRRAYYCPACGGWHVTSSPEKEQRSIDQDRELSNKVLPPSIFKCKPNNNVLVPLFSKIMKLAVRALDLGYIGQKERALFRCQESLSLIDKTEELGRLLGVKTKQVNKCKTFRNILEDIKSALNESPIDKVRLDELMTHIYWVIEGGNRNNFSYSPYNTGGHDFKVTSSNIDEVLENLRKKEKEKEREEQLSKEINMLIPAAEMCINYGKYNQAKSNISDSISKAMKLSVPEKRIQYVFRCLELIIKKNWVPKEELEELFKGTEYESSLEELIEKYT